MRDFTLEIEAMQLPRQVRPHPAPGNKLLWDLPGRNDIYFEGLHPHSHFRTDFCVGAHSVIHWLTIRGALALSHFLFPFFDIVSLLQGAVHEQTVLNVRASERPPRWTVVNLSNIYVM